MPMIAKYLVKYCLGISIVLTCFCDNVFALGDKYLTIYGAIMTGDSLKETYHLEAGFDSSYKILAFALGRRGITQRGSDGDPAFATGSR